MDSQQHLVLRGVRGFSQENDASNVMQAWRGAAESCQWARARQDVFALKLARMRHTEESCKHFNKDTQWIEDQIAALKRKAWDELLDLETTTLQDIFRELPHVTTENRDALGWSTDPEKVDGAAADEPPTALHA